MPYKDRPPLGGLFLYCTRQNRPAQRLCLGIQVRIPRPKIDKLACQAQGVGILAFGEIPVAECLYGRPCFYDIPTERTHHRCCSHTAAAKLKRGTWFLRYLASCGAISPPLYSRNNLHKLNPAQQIPHCGCHIKTDHQTVVCFYIVLVRIDLLRGSASEYRFAYPVRKSTSSLVRRRAWVYSPLARYLLLNAFTVDLVFMTFLRNERTIGAVRIPLPQSLNEALGSCGILRRAEISVSRSIRGTSSAYSPRTANSCLSNP